jgi:hypothetical protein
MPPSPSLPPHYTPNLTTKAKCHPIDIKRDWSPDNNFEKRGQHEGVIALLNFFNGNKIMHCRIILVIPNRLTKKETYY